MIPTLETERLRLRRWEMKDFEPYAALRTDPELQKFIAGPVAHARVWEDFCSRPGEWAVRGMGVFLVADRTSDLAVGYAGLWFPPGQVEPELCWSLFPGNAGRGYATEAASAARGWAYESLKLPALMSFVHPENHASRAVAGRLGALVEGETELHGSPRLVYRHPQFRPQS